MIKTKAEFDDTCDMCGEPISRYSDCYDTVMGDKICVFCHDLDDEIEYDEDDV